MPASTDLAHNLTVDEASHLGLCGECRKPADDYSELHDLVMHPACEDIFTIRMSH